MASREGADDGDAAIGTAEAEHPEPEEGRRLLASKASEPVRPLTASGVM